MQRPSGRRGAGLAVATIRGSSIKTERKVASRSRPRDSTRRCGLSRSLVIEWATSAVPAENTGAKLDASLGERYVAFNDADRIAWKLYMGARLHPRKRQREGRSHPGRALGREVAAHGAPEVTADRQPQPNMGVRDVSTMPTAVRRLGDQPPTGPRAWPPVAGAAPRGGSTTRCRG